MLVYLEGSDIFAKMALFENIILQEKCLKIISKLNSQGRHHFKTPTFSVDTVIQHGSRSNCLARDRNLSRVNWLCNTLESLQKSPITLCEWIRDLLSNCSQIRVFNYGAQQSSARVSDI